ncbi:uncharacterized protein LOC107040153 [Diachasma alloeum]|uniref:uncharacterized protein LOC107040153 n=1 Tax=Diachasma alloeum TaxID=454923 RepID=UPI0007382F7F|nr:uncharacterized protein LOC107040153 [Diachasma alloeum]
MNTSSFLCLVFTIFCVISQIYALSSCRGIPPEAWCTNEEIATLCKVLNQCKSYWSAHGIVPNTTQPSVTLSLELTTEPSVYGRVKFSSWDRTKRQEYDESDMNHTEDEKMWSIMHISNHQISKEGKEYYEKILAEYAKNKNLTSDMFAPFKKRLLDFSGI